MNQLFKFFVPALALISASAYAEPAYYKNPEALFSKRPDPTAPIAHVERFGPVGLAIDLMQPAFTMRIKAVEEGSPAEAAGLKPAMIIHSINGEKLADIDPRIQLGNLITRAEATDGKIVMQVSDEAGTEAREVSMQIPVLGTYSETWPLDCPKSDKIVRNYAEYLKAGGTQGFALGHLFLLSTGDESDLEYVRKWARSKPKEGVSFHTWNAGLGNIALCEYYLRTGDEEVLPAIQAVADVIAEAENNGGWGNRAPLGHLDYGGGGGHLNAGGLHAATTLVLAKECGAEVDEETLTRVIRHFYRWAGRGNISYGNHKPESGYIDNGKNGGLALLMAAAASLTPDGDDSLYARARDVSALFSFPSTSFMLHGHTGGGIGEIFRSAAMSLLHGKRPALYRDFMDQRRWHYELSRRYDGSFGILAGRRYDKEKWGGGYALSYTLPRKHLRLAGAPSKFAKPFQLPEQVWGTAEDNAFVSIEAIAYPDGSRPDFSQETLASGGGLALLKLRSGDITDEQLNRYIRHPIIATRTFFSGQILKRGPEFISQLLHDEDARLRRLALDTLAPRRNADPSRVAPEHLSRALEMLQDPEESLFVKEAALRLVGLAPIDSLVQEVGAILPYLEHEEWWLQHSAVVALTPVIVDKRVYREVLPALGDMLERNHLYNVTSPLLWGEIPEKIRNADPEVAALAREELKQAYDSYVDFEHEMDAVEDRINTGMRETMAITLAKLPGGYETLYEIGKERYPDKTLPFEETFLKADPERLSPKLRQVILEYRKERLLPAYLEKHQEALAKEAVSIEPGRRRAAMKGLLKLYAGLGISEFDWANYGPDRTRMKWWYHSYDPKEKWLKAGDRLGRYREVTFPAGMEQWFTPGFDPAKAGWEQGLAPFGAADGKLARFDDESETLARTGGCPLSFCGCHEPLQTLWEKDVLLLHGEFEFPKFEEGYRYRLLHGGISHVGSGGGFRVYINGKMFYEDTTGVDRRGGARPEGRVIPRDWWSEFNEGPVTLSAITFKKHHPRTEKYGGNISLFVQRMKVPPILQAAKTD
jgi:hypothetical protein